MSTSPPFPGYTVCISRVFNFPFQNLGGHNANILVGGSKRHLFFRLPRLKVRWVYPPHLRSWESGPDSTLPAIPNLHRGIPWQPSGRSPMCRWPMKMRKVPYVFVPPVKRGIGETVVTGNTASMGGAARESYMNVNGWFLWDQLVRKCSINMDPYG